ncbi:MAG: response regulator transcription factor [Candidatus Taylorbacteria bacterium]|nr:response regulator transcription factor [Candidatus Taylorbacteria bacterium]
MKVLVVDDDASLAETIKGSLSAYSHTVDLSPDGADGSFLARSYDYDAVILDYSMPKKDGLSVCREIRAAGKTMPILFLSNTDDVETKISAFKVGADDYVTKPFSLEELRVRLDAVLRRTPNIKNSVLKIADLTLDQSMNAVSRGKKAVHLTRKEFHMLEYFMKNVGKVLSRAQIMEHVWTADGNPFSNTVEAHIRNLRMKINVDDSPNLIANVPGRGYMIDTPENLALL